MKILLVDCHKPFLLHRPRRRSCLSPDPSMSTNLSKTLNNANVKASAKPFGGPTSRLAGVKVNGMEYLKFPGETSANIGSVLGASAFTAGIAIRVKRMVAENFNSIVADGVADAAMHKTLFGKTIRDAIAADLKVILAHTIPPFTLWSTTRVLHLCRCSSALTLRLHRRFVFTILHQVTNQVVDHGGNRGAAAEPIIQVKARTADDFKIPFHVNGVDGVSDAAVPCDAHDVLPMPDNIKFPCSVSELLLKTVLCGQLIQSSRSCCSVRILPSLPTQGTARS